MFVHVIVESARPQRPQSESEGENKSERERERKQERVERERLLEHERWDEIDSESAEATEREREREREQRTRVSGARAIQRRRGGGVQEGGVRAERAGGETYLRAVAGLEMVGDGPGRRSKR